MFTKKFFTFFPPPKLLNTPFTGLDISDDAIRCIQFAPGKKGLEISKFGEVMLPAKVIESGYINDEKTLRTILTAFAKKNNLSHVTVSLPEEKMYLFSTEVPTLSPREANQNIEFKLEENVPLSPANAVFDFDPLRTVAGARNRVSVSVAPRKVIDAYLSALIDSGLTPLSFEIQARALARALVPVGKGATHVLVHIMDKKTGIYIVSDKVVCFTSTVPFGSNAITEAISRELGSSIESAEKFKIEHGYTDCIEAKKIFGAVANVLSNIKDEIHKVNSYWQSHDVIDHKVTSIIISGRDARLCGLSDYLTSTTGIPVEVGNVWGNALSFNGYIPPIEMDKSLDYAVAVGLALNSI